MRRPYLSYLPIEPPRVSLLYQTAAEANHSPWTLLKRSSCSTAAKRLSILSLLFRFELRAKRCTTKTSQPRQLISSVSTASQFPQATHRVVVHFLEALVAHALGHGARWRCQNGAKRSGFRAATALALGRCAGEQSCGEGGAGGEERLAAAGSCELLVRRWTGSSDCQSIGTSEYL